MSDIIKSDTLLAISNINEPQGFHVGDYVTDSRNESLLKLVSCETVKISNGEYKRFHVVYLNPITLEKENTGFRERDISDSELHEYYHVIAVDPFKMRDVAHKIIFEGLR